MKNPRQMSKTATLAECAVLAAVAFALSLIPGFKMPLGGSISWFATVPILIAAMRHGSGWGIGTALVYSATQLLLGLHNFSWLPKTFGAFFGCAMLDYIISYTQLGFAGALYGAFRCKNQVAGITIAVVITGLGRLLCSFLSGILVWGESTPEGWPVALYSLAYNAAWSVPDFVLALIAVLALSRVKALSVLPAEA